MEHKNKIRLWALVLFVTVSIAAGIAILGTNINFFKGDVDLTPIIVLLPECSTLTPEQCIASSNSDRCRPGFLPHMCETRPAPPPADCSTLTPEECQASANSSRCAFIPERRDTFTGVVTPYQCMNRSSDPSSDSVSIQIQITEGSYGQTSIPSPTSDLIAMMYGLETIDRSITVNSVTLTKTGNASIPTDVYNLRLFYNSSLISSNPNISGDTITFSGLDFIISPISSTLTLKVDVMESAISGNNFKFNIATAPDATVGIAATRDGNRLNLSTNLPAVVTDTPPLFTIGRPNLIIDGTPSNTQPTTVGMQIRFQATVRNQGTVASTESNTVLQLDKQYNASTGFVSDFNLGTTTRALAPNGTTTVWFTDPRLTPVASDIGTIAYRVCAAAQTDGSGGNCSSVQQFQVTPAETASLTVTTPSVASATNTFTLTPDSSWGTSGTTTTVAAFNLRNNSTQTISVSRIKLTKSGIGNDGISFVAFVADLENQNIDEVSMSETLRLISGRISTWNNIEWNANPALPPLAIGPSRIAKIYVLGTILQTATVGSNFRFSINASSDIAAVTEAGSAVTINGPPIQGPLFNIAAASADQPNLVIQTTPAGPSYSPAAPLAGSTMTFNAVVKNQSATATANASFTNLLIDQNSGTFSNADVTLPFSTPSIAANGTTPATWAWSNATAGTHAFKICANAGSAGPPVFPAIAESNPADNCSAPQTFTVAVPANPDLFIQSLGSPAFAPAIPPVGSSMTFQAAVGNRGAGTAPVSQTNLVIDEGITGAPNPIGTSTPILTPAGTANVWFTWTNPTNGPHTYKICANAGTSPVAGPANTCSPVQAFNVAQAQSSILQVARSSSSPVSGQVQVGTDNFAATVLSLTNNSPAPITVNSVTLQISGTALPADLANFKLFEGTAQIGQTVSYWLPGTAVVFSPMAFSINAGQTKQLTIKVQVVSSATANRIFSMGVSGMTVSPSSATISGLVATGNDFTISGVAQPLARPDLAGQSLSILPSGTINAGQTIIFSGQLFNVGAGAASNFGARFCVDNPSCLTNTTGMVGENAITGLAATSSMPVSSSQWVATQGSHTFYLCVDTAQIVEETTEANNCASLPFAVQTAQVQAPPASGQPLAQTPATSSLASNQPVQPSATSPQSQFQYRPASPNLTASQRLVSAPERGQTGPEALLYFGVLAAIQGGIWLKKKLRK